ncbi:MAG TPA: hypothetical protein EYP53_08135 [Candidatus Latescibacteria bacterium]|nr:hypothetical protein [Candidatus Latescibacterota bacterium]
MSTLQSSVVTRVAMLLVPMLSKAIGLITIMRFPSPALPPYHRTRMRTTNGIERLNKEIKRRTRVAGLFPNEDSLLRLVSAVLVETSDDWETGNVYLNIKSQ